MQATAGSAGRRKRSDLHPRSRRLERSRANAAASFSDSRLRSSLLQPRSGATLAAALREMRNYPSK